MKKSKIVRFLFIPLLLILIGITLSGSNRFVAKRIDCFTQFGPCPSDLSSPLSLLVGHPLYKPLPRKEISSQFKNHPAIKSVTLYRRLPSTIVATITLRRPIGAVGPAVLGSYSIVDESGMVFNQLDNAQLPLLISPDQPHIGSTISQNQKKALDLLNFIGSFSSNQISGELNGDVLTVNFSSHMLIILDINKSVSNRNSPLQQILSRSKISGKLPAKIDLRYNNPIITD